MNKPNQRFIVWFVLFTLLTTGLTSGVSFVYSYLQFKNNTEQQLRESAVSYSHELNGVIYGIETTVNTIANNLEGLIDQTRINDPAYYDSIHLKLESLAKKFDHNEINVTSFYVRFDPAISSGTSGVFHADTNNDGLMETQQTTDLSKYPETDVEHVGWFYVPFNSEHAAWMMPYYNANIKTNMVSYVSPLRVNGRTIGIVGMDVDFRELKKITQNHLGPGKVILVDQSYAFMVHDVFTMKDTVSSIDGGKLAKLQNVLETNTFGTLHYELNDVPKVLGFSKLRNGWTVIVALTEEEAFNSFNRTSLILLGLNVAMSLLMAGVALFAGRFIHKLVNRNTSLEIEVEKRTVQLRETNEYLEESVAELENQQAELAIMNNQLEEALQKQTEMQEQLIVAEKLSSLGELVAGVAHEINTPIGNAVTLNSFVQQQIHHLQTDIKQNKLTETQLNETLETLEESNVMMGRTLKRVSELVELFKQMTNDRQLLDIRRVQVNNLMEDVLVAYKEAFNENGHVIKTSCGNGLELVTYPMVMKQILIQLVSNAYIHGFEGLNRRELSIECNYDLGWITLIVTDNGKGMPRDLMNKAFDPFVTTKKNKGSVGLGLHLVHNLVTQTLKGTIELKSEIGKGTTITIIFPDLTEDSTQ